METGADFQQAGDAGVDGHPAGGWFGDAAEDLESGGFSGAIAADDADTVAGLDLEADVLERPEFLDLVALHDLPAGEPVAGLAGEVFGIPRQHVTQGGVTLGPNVVVADKVGLGEIFDLEGFHESLVVSHQFAVGSLQWAV